MSINEISMSINDDMAIYTEISMLGQVFIGGYYND